MTETNGHVCEVCGCPPTEWLRVHTVAARLGKSERTVRRYCRDGTLRARRHRGAYLVAHHGPNGLDEILRRRLTVGQAARQRRECYAETEDSLSALAGCFAGPGDGVGLRERLDRLTDVSVARIADRLAFVVDALEL